ncbi:MAG TPA: EAL domain-containing protein [Solirubrobacteraceae bacterium]|nr:EAL domain-containing protein [Solirubrobacteraceae bacterium]
MGNVLEDSSTRLFFKDREGRFLLVSSGFVEALASGRSADDVIGKTDFDFFAPEHASAALRDEQEVISTGEPMIAKVERETFPDRGDIWVRTTKLPLRNEKGDVLGVWGTSRDITVDRAVEYERRRLASIVAAASDAIISVDSAGLITSWNTGAQMLLGYEPEEMLGAPIERILPPDGPAGSVTLAERASARERSGRFESQRRHKDGTSIDVEVTAFPLIDGDDKVTGGAEIIRDIRERAQQAIALAASERRYYEILERTPDGVCRIDDLNHVDYANTRMAEMLGYSVDEMIGRDFGEFMEREWLQIANRAVDGDGDGDGPPKTVLEGRLQRKDGAPCWARISMAAVTGTEGERCGSLAILSDITEAKFREEALRSTESLVSAVADGMVEGMFALDAEGRLTYMNQAAEQLLGWGEDELRGKLMHEMIHSVRPDGSVYRPEDCPLMSAGRTGAPVKVEDDVFVMRDGALLPVAYSSSPVFLAEGGGAVVVFRDITDLKSEEMKLSRELEALKWVGRIRDALDEGRFVLYAQPVVELGSGEVTQYELLIRMLGSRGEVIPPGAFLPTAERYGLIEEIDEWVFEQAARLVGLGHAVALHFNLSGKTLAIEDVAQRIHTTLQTHGADPAKLICEITETALIEHAMTGERFVRELNQLGCQVALDDFGTGYGGFSYLKRLPVSYLKIDREFVADLAVSAASRHVVRAIVNLAQGFGQKTIAEGVEDRETLELLKEMSVDFAQGYFIARPAPVTEVLRAGEAPPKNKGDRTV